LIAVFAEDVRVYRPGQEPYLGRAAAEKAAAGLPGKWTWEPADCCISASADLGYTYGTLEAGQDPFCYFRIWKRTGQSWRLVLDLLSPIPRKS
jgi:hypothetical protein